VPLGGPGEDVDAAIEVVARELLRDRGHVHALARADRHLRVEDEDATSGRDATLREWVASGDETQKNSRWSAEAYTGDTQGRPSRSAVPSAM
jgi:hypothetical protein